VNRVPTDEDLHRVIERGMPGSAMVPFGHLARTDRDALVAYVRHLTRAGLEAQIRKQAEANGTQLSDKELKSELELMTVPGTLVSVPADLPGSSPESVARGRALFLSACAPCHGQTGKGDGVQEQRDDKGMPTRPRDLTRGIFKGGRDPHRLYTLFYTGMPGTPMPAIRDYSTPQVGDLINFVLSLSDPSTPAKVEHRRTQLVARRTPADLTGEIADREWEAVPPVGLVLSPLWWRDYPEPAFQVQALHDGKTLALRLTWNDPSCNERVGRTEDFEDMAAVQLFRGSPEPFLGMGSASAQTDLWLWRASWQRPAEDVGGQLDDYPFDSALYKDIVKGKGQPPDFLTARAAGNQQAHADPAQSASSLTAKGFGSTTFRPRASQAVTAHSTWADGRWTVVLRRPLRVGSDEGLSLAPGEACSVSFAVWDGEYRDRNGQKLITIWHDLKLD
jgi:mono/diheme cytochrome c family protein